MIQSTGGGSDGLSVASGSAGRLLRRHVPGCAEHRADRRVGRGGLRPGGGGRVEPDVARARGSPVVASQLGETEVQDLQETVARQHQVLGLEVPVHDAGSVGLGEAVGGLRGDLQQPPRGARPAFLGQQQPAQRLAVDALHHDVRQAGGLADLVDRDDVRVIERGRRARLLSESSEAHRIRRETLGQELHRHVPVQVLVARAPDVAHPASPQAGHELETREPHAGEGRQSMPPERPESTSDGSRDYAPL
jgi:hypothetical protein